MLSKIKHYINQIKKGRLKELLAELAWIYSHAKRYTLFIGLYTLLGLSGTITTLFAGLVSRDLVDIITGHNTGALISTFLTMIGMTLGTTLISQLSTYISTKISIKIDNDIKAKIFDDILITDWEALSRYHSGDLLVRWSGDVSSISSGILSIVPNLIIYLFRFVSALIMVLYYDASFAIFALVSIPISITASRITLKRMRQNNMQSMSVGTKMSSFNQETFSNIQTVKAFDMIPLYSKRLRELQKQYSDIRLKYQRTAIANTFILTIVSMLVTYSSYAWGIYKVWSGDITYGTMTMFLSLSGTLSASVDNLISFVPSTIMFTNSAKRLMGIANLPKENYSAKDEVAQFFETNKNIGVGLSIRNAAYTYATGTEVFENATFDAHPHEVIALVGPSGEGKTTMLRLLLSIIRAKEGEGFICAGDSTPENGKPCMDLTASTRQLFAYVPQGNTMFSGTIADNMRNVKEDATDEEIISALKIACAWDFVEKLPSGINTEIKERGGGFSEGQAQRLSIARALLRRSPILLLDEATSALDIMTERKVLKNIMDDKYPRTTIVTTHRPTVLNSCTRVYSISNKQCRLMTADEIAELIHN
ncbi:MAG: ABC transporter ATP-binding protein [Lachnospiraceae bacterium]|nr:ABC transporter ATP-binding protein [Lachnospiraceae bacterium]